MSNKIAHKSLQWIKADYESHRFRFIVEVLAWVISIGCALVMSFTVPNPPLIILYPIWVAGCVVYSWASWTRKSFGMLANYVLLTAIDTIGLIRLFAN